MGCALVNLGELWKMADFCRNLFILLKNKVSMNSSTEQASGFSVKTEKCEASGKDCRSFILIFKETCLILDGTPVK